MLVLRDVLGFGAAEVAGMLDASEASVTSALQRARAALDAIVALLTDDAVLTMPPEPGEYVGAAAIAVFLANRFGTHPGRRVRLIPTRANGQPAFGHYIQDAQSPICHSFGVVVLTLEGDRIAKLTRFGDTGILPQFGLPRTLPE